MLINSNVSIIFLGDSIDFGSVVITLPNSPVILSIHFKTIGTERLTGIPTTTYQNFTPVDGWEIYLFEKQRNMSFFIFSGVILHNGKSIID